MELGKLRMRTLQEFLASILLEEGFVGDRAVEVIHHELEDRVDLFLSVSRVMSESGILRMVSYRKITHKVM
jgi:hypothetical protein